MTDFAFLLFVIGVSLALGKAPVRGIVLIVMAVSL